MNIKYVQNCVITPCNENNLGIQGKEGFLVEWDGYPDPSSDTWEPADNVVVLSNEYVDWCILRRE